MAVSTANATAPRGDFLAGAAKAAPFIIMLIPFGAVFGVVARNSGLDLTQTMAFSGAVIAGASQFTAVQLLVDDAPVAVIVATALAVNLRMMMYSIAMVPHLGPAPLWQRALIAYLNVDQTYALSVAEYETRPEMPIRNRVAYFVGTAAPIVPCWILSTLAGATLGRALPESMPVDFVLPLMFLGMASPMMKTRAHAAAALVASGAAILFTGFPAGTGLLAAAILGMIAGAVVDDADPNRRPT
ncbi:AzlC family ABC transporter permease [Tranquillimonas rosea]|uniref:AzlC family ABC transporter permease n=1 Tax=Tranquillimonas rosea TaxID=641238 RepID=UPI003BA9D5F2